MSTSLAAASQLTFITGSYSTWDWIRLTKITLNSIKPVVVSRTGRFSSIALYWSGGTFKRLKNRCNPYSGIDLPFVSTNAQSILWGGPFRINCLIWTIYSLLIGQQVERLRQPPDLVSLCRENLQNIKPTQGKMTTTKQTSLIIGRHSRQSTSIIWRTYSICDKLWLTIKPLVLSEEPMKNLQPARLLFGLLSTIRHKRPNPSRETVSLG